MKKTWVIVNPHSGRGKGLKALSEIDRRIGNQAMVVATTHRGHATELAREAVNAGAEIVLAAGGDGTLHEVLNGITSTTVLGLIPVGTGNDFGRHIGIRTIDEAIALADKGSVQMVDYGKLRFGSESLDFLNIIGVGFDAAVATRINRGFRWLRGTSAYMAAVLITLKDYLPVPLIVTVDEQSPIELNATLCAFANSSSYGGGMKVAPQASIQDGYLDIVCVGKVSRLDFLRTFPQVFKGTHLSHPSVQTFRGRRIHVSSPTRMPILIDGEIKGTTPFDVEVVPFGRPFLMPS